MSNIQLFIAVAIPSLLVLVNILSTRQQSSRIDALTKEVANLRVSLTKEVTDVRVALANLRAELYEKFTPKSHA